MDFSIYMTLSKILLFKGEILLPAKSTLSGKFIRK